MMSNLQISNLTIRNKYYHFSDDNNDGEIGQINDDFIQNNHTESTKDNRPDISKQISANTDKSGTAFVKKEKEEQRIGVIEEVEPWLVDNHYILTGYRIGYHKFMDVFKTLFK
jgi:hypothetical protein